MGFTGEGSQRQREADMKTRITELEAERDELAAQLAALAGALESQHEWHLAQGTQIIEGFELDMAAEYCDSTLCEKTTQALANLSPRAQRMLANQSRMASILNPGLIGISQCIARDHCAKFVVKLIYGTQEYLDSARHGLTGDADALDKGESKALEADDG